MSFSQNHETGARLLNKLDSITHSNSISKYFAGLYCKTTIAAQSFFFHSDENVQAFMQRLEIRFGNYFLDAANSFKSGSEIPPVWSNYYKKNSLSPVQYLLLGANAHINGDIWQALTAEFSLQEIRDNKHQYFSFYKELKKVYVYVYGEAIASSTKLRLLHQLTLGLDKVYGKLMLYRWRRRQMQLAILYFTNPDRFEKKMRKVRKKMKNIDRLIIRMQ